MQRQDGYQIPQREAFQQKEEENIDDYSKKRRRDLALLKGMWKCTYLQITLPVNLIKAYHVGQKTSPQNMHKSMNLKGLPAYPKELDYQRLEIGPINHLLHRGGNVMGRAMNPRVQEMKDPANLRNEACTSQPPRYQVE